MTLEHGDKISEPRDLAASVDVAYLNLCPAATDTRLESASGIRQIRPRFPSEVNVTTVDVVQELVEKARVGESLHNDLRSLCHHACFRATDS